MLSSPTFTVTLQLNHWFLSFLFSIPFISHTHNTPMYINTHHDFLIASFLQIVFFSTHFERPIGWGIHTNTHQTSMLMENQNLLSLFIFLFLGHWIHVQAAPPHSLVTQLPGFYSRFPSNHYSGYVICVHISSFCCL